MKNPNFPALVAMLIIWAIGAIGLALIYLVARIITGQSSHAPVVSAETLAPLFEDVPAPKATRPKRSKVSSSSLAAMIKAESMA
jgi:hypothetical protein